ncbi:MAG: DNA primase, partial [Patescibacteria group bacterium]
MVSPERQTWHCFGSCSEGGDIFKFLMKYENLEFYEVLKILAEKAGIELRQIAPAEQKQFNVLYEINEEAKEFFKKNLEGSVEAKKYLLDRGLKKETIEEFELGFSSNKWEELSLYLIKKKYSAFDIERAGLAYKNERGSLIDRFRGRIMFPIHNHFGKVIGFSGRILPEFDAGEVGKYINSPETLIFNKSKILYGFYKSKNFIREAKIAVLVEGQMDFLACWQDGVKNIAAVSGTALTTDHLKVLKRQTDQLIFCFDNDEAGLKAAERSIDLANSQDFNVKILTLKNYKDPAEAIFKNPGIMAGWLNEAKLAMEFYFERYLLNVDQHKDIGEFKKNLRIVLGKIKILVSPIERNHWLKNLSLKTGVKEEALMDEMAQIKTISNFSALSTQIQITQSSNNSVPQSRRELIAERLIGLVINDESLINQIKEYFIYLPENYSAIVQCLINKTKPADEQVANLLDSISLNFSFKNIISDKKKPEEEFIELLRHLKAEYLKDKREELVKFIKKTENDGNEKEINSALEEFDKVSKLIHNI